MIIGYIPDMEYLTSAVKIEACNKLFIFSDGVYEVEYADGRGFMTFDEFKDELSKPVPKDVRKVEQMLSFASNAQGSATFEDDFTLVELSFLYQPLSKGC